MKRVLKYILFSYLIVMVIITLVSCKKKDRFNITISEVAHSVFYAPSYVAMSQGFFADEGLTVSLYLANGANTVMSTLLSKDVQIGLAGAEATIYVYNEGEKNYGINFAQLTQKDGNFLMGRNSAENFNWNDLKGKSILGGRKGGMPEMVLEYALKQKGLTVGRDNQGITTTGGVNVRTDVQFASLAGKFASGEGDYVILFEPTATITQKNGQGYILDSLGVESGIIPYTNYFCLKDYLEKNEDVIQKFTNAIYKATRWVYSHTPLEVANAISSQFPDSTIEELTAVMERYMSIEAWAKSPVMNKEAYELFLDIMEEAGELTTRTSYDSIVTTKYAQNAVNSNK